MVVLFLQTHPTIFRGVCEVTEFKGVGAVVHLYLDLAKMEHVNQRYSPKIDGDKSSWFFKDQLGWISPQDNTQTNLPETFCGDEASSFSLFVVFTAVRLHPKKGFRIFETETA